MRLEFGHADASGRQRPSFTSWPSSSCRLSSRTSWHPSSSPLPSSPCCPPSLSEWRDQTVQARIAMHCGQLLQRNEENRESSEKRVDNGNADQTGVAAPRRVEDKLERAPRDASAHAREENGGVEEILISCGFPARRRILPRPRRRARNVRLTISSNAGQRRPSGCGQSKKSAAGESGAEGVRPSSLALVGANQWQAIRAWRRRRDLARARSAPSQASTHAGGRSTPTPPRDGNARPLAHLNRAAVKDRACVGAVR
jgi:hypothetical protein